MDRGLKENITLTAVMFGFFTESVIGGLGLFDKYFAISEAPTIADVAVKGISVNTYDSILNLAYVAIVVAANIVAISIVLKHGIKKH